MSTNQRTYTDAEVTELVLVGQVDDLGEVAHAASAQLVLDVEGVLERSALAGAGAVTRAAACRRGGR